MAPAALANLAPAQYPAPAVATSSGRLGPVKCTGLHGVDGQPLIYPTPLFVRNTFIDTEDARPDSLDEFIPERRVASCPTSWVDDVDGEADTSGKWPELVERPLTRSKTAGDMFKITAQLQRGSGKAAAAGATTTAAPAAASQAASVEMPAHGLVATADMPTHQAGSVEQDVRSECSTIDTAQSPGAAAACSPLCRGSPSLPAPTSGVDAIDQIDQTAALNTSSWQQLPPEFRERLRLADPLQPPPLQPPPNDFGLASAAVPAAAEAAAYAYAGVPLEEPLSALPSVGSYTHEGGQCKPCAFMHSKGCKTGKACQFCHLCEPGEKKRRQKEKRAFFSTMRQLRQFAVDSFCSSSGTEQVEPAA